jgi:hypothetical protein
VATKPRLLWLGFGKFARSDRIYALEPLLGEDEATTTAALSRSTSRPTRNVGDAAGNRSLDQWLAIVIEARRVTPGRTV